MFGSSGHFLPVFSFLFRGSKFSLPVLSREYRSEAGEGFVLKPSMRVGKVDNENELL